MATTTTPIMINDIDLPASAVVAASIPMPHLRICCVHRNDCSRSFNGKERNAAKQIKPITSTKRKRLMPLSKEFISWNKIFVLTRRRNGRRRTPSSKFTTLTPRHLNFLFEFILYHILLQISSSEIHRKAKGHETRKIYQAPIAATSCRATTSKSATKS